MIDAANLAYLRLVRSATAQIGDRLYTLGTPLGFLQNTLSEGLLSGVRQMDGYKLFQLSAPISPGSSGSPVFNAQGEVIGIVKATIEEGQNLNFAIPIDYTTGMMNARLQSLSSFYEPEEQRQQATTITSTRASGEVFPTHWKSLQSGTSKIIRRDGDRLYVETVMSDVQKNAGCFQMADLKGKEYFSGTVRFSCVCQYTKGLGKLLTNRFTWEHTIEITLLSPTRIEGREVVPPKDAKLDCAKGDYDQPANRWQEFVWIPE